jgi:group I intron endonuclease
MFIYQITNIITNDFYIGKTTRKLEQRLYQHNYETFNRNSQTYLHRAIRKYGKNNFEISILDEAFSNQELNEKEKIWIENKKPQYNMTKGGDGGDVSKSPNYIKSQKNKSYKHTEESKLKISEGNKKKKKPLSEETKNKLSSIRKGRKMPPRSDEWKLKQSLSQKGKSKKPFTEEHKNNLKKSWLKRKGII